MLHLHNKPALFRQRVCEAEVGWDPHLLSAQPVLLSDPAGVARQGKEHLYSKESTNNVSWPPGTLCVLFLCLSAYFCFLMTALGVTAGAHRLWSHRSYKAKLPLRIFLAAANSMAFQVSSCCLFRFLASRHLSLLCRDPLSFETAKERNKKNWQKDRKTFICCNSFCWLRGCRAPLTTHVTMCTGQTRSNNYIRTKLNVTKLEAQHLSNWSVAQVRPHTSQDSMETFIRVSSMQMCLCVTKSLFIQVAGDFVPRNESRHPFTILIYLCFMQRFSPAKFKYVCEEVCY